MFDPRVDYIIAEFKKFNQQFCKKAKCCLGISENGNPNLVLNQQGDWITAGEGDIQDLLSDLPEYLGAKEASEDGKPIGYWYYNTFYNNVAKVTEFINRYSAGTAPITFMPDGSNGWNIGIIAQPTTLQIPSGETIDSVAYEIRHFVGGTNTGTISGTLTSDDTINTGALGAGTFEISLIYHISDGSEVSPLYAFQVDATDVIIDYCKINGTIVNSVNGLYLSLSSNIESSVFTTVTWYSFDGGPNFIQVGTGVNATITMPLGAIYVVPVITLGSGFPDYPSNELSSHFSVTIS